MIQGIPGWSMETVADHVVLKSAGGSIFYRERAPDDTSLLGMLRELAEGLRMKVATTTARFLTTEEGEYALLISSLGEVEGRPASCHVGSVVFEGGRSVLGALSASSAVAEFTLLVFRLLRTAELRLSPLRRRPYCVTPPSHRLVGRDEQALVWAIEGTSATMTIHLAEPAVGPIEEVITRVSGSDGPPAAPPSPVATGEGLDGHRWQWHTGDRLVIIYALDDGRYRYCIKMNCAAADSVTCLPALERAVDSVHALPYASRSLAAPRGEVTSFWAE